MHIVYQHALAPEAYTLDVTPGDSGIDLSTVTSVVLKVRKYAATADLTWAAEIVSQSPTLLSIRHAFAPGDLDTIGLTTIFAVLTMSNAVVRTKTRSFRVADAHEVLI